MKHSKFRAVVGNIITKVKPLNILRRQDCLIRCPQLSDHERNLPPICWCTLHIYHGATEPHSQKRRLSIAQTLRGFSTSPSGMTLFCPALTWLGPHPCYHLYPHHIILYPFTSLLSLPLPQPNILPFSPFPAFDSVSLSVAHTNNSKGSPNSPTTPSSPASCSAHSASAFPCVHQVPPATFAVSVFVHCASPIHVQMHCDNSYPTAHFPGRSTLLFPSPPLREAPSHTHLNSRFWWAPLSCQSGSLPWFTRGIHNKVTSDLCVHQSFVHAGHNPMWVFL